MLAPDQVKGQSYTFLSEISMFYRFVIVYDIDQDLTWFPCQGEARDSISVALKGGHTGSWI